MLGGSILSALDRTHHRNQVIEAGQVYKSVKMSRVQLGIHASVQRHYYSSLNGSILVLFLLFGILVLLALCLFLVPAGLAMMLNTVRTSLQSNKGSKAAQLDTAFEPDLEGEELKLTLQAPLYIYPCPSPLAQSISAISMKSQPWHERERSMAWMLRRQHKVIVSGLRHSTDLFVRISSCLPH